MTLFKSKFNSKKAFQLFLLSAGTVLCLNTAAQAITLVKNNDGFANSIEHSSEDTYAAPLQIENLSTIQLIQIAQFVCNDYDNIVVTRGDYSVVNCGPGIYYLTDGSSKARFNLSEEGDYVCVLNGYLYTYDPRTQTLN